MVNVAVNILEACEEAELQTEHQICRMEICQLCGTITIPYVYLFIYLFFLHTLPSDSGSLRAL